MPYGKSLVLLSHARVIRLVALGDPSGVAEQRIGAPSASDRYLIGNIDHTIDPSAGMLPLQGFFRSDNR